MKTNSKLTPQIVAKFFLTKEELTPKKIQKLVYYSYAWFIALNNERPDSIANKLFDEKPEAWLHGPVFRSLYKTYKNYGWTPAKKERTIPKEIGANKDLVAFLNKIWDTFGEYDADTLEYMTHKETPWKKARIEEKSLSSKRNQMRDSEIFLYYNAIAQEN